MLSTDVSSYAGCRRDVLLTMPLLATDLSWVGHVVDLVDGRVQVKWADNNVSLVMIPASITTCMYLHLQSSLLMFNNLLVN